MYRAITTSNASVSEHHQIVNIINGMIQLMTNVMVCDNLTEKYSLQVICRIFYNIIELIK